MKLSKQVIQPTLPQVSAIPRVSVIPPIKQQLRLIGLVTIAVTALLTPVTQVAQAQINFNRQVELDLFKWLDTHKGGKGTAIRMDDVPTGSSGYLYSMSAGPIDRVNVPAIFKITPEYNLGLEAGWGYSCGKFNAFANVQGMINKAMDKFKQLPQMFVSGVTGMIAGLPAYLLNKINPSLYNVVTKNLDDAFDLFDMNFKSCQQVERDIADGQNPFADILRFAKAEKQATVIKEMGGTHSIDEQQKEVNEQSMSVGVTTVGGAHKGGEGQEPLNYVEDITIAGYNLLIGRSDTASKADAPAGAAHPITKVFKNPEQAYLYLMDIYGHVALNPTDKIQSKGATGWQFKNTERKLSHIESLTKYINKQITRKKFEEDTGISAIPAEISAIRDMDRYARDVAIDAKGRAEALRDTRIRLEYLMQILRAGINEPNIQKSFAHPKFAQNAWMVYSMIQEDLYRLNLSETQY